MKNKLKITLLVTFCLLALLCGCGKSKQEKVDKALQGSWKTSKEEVLGMQFEWVFSEGRFDCFLCVDENKSALNKGTYIINENTITLQYEEGEKGELILNYTMDKDILSLSFDDGRKLHDMNE